LERKNKKNKEHDKNEDFFSLGDEKYEVGGGKGNIHK
jgi:hypothetical protein